MRQLSSILLWLLLSSTAAFAQNNPVPLLNVPLSPSVATPGGSGFTLTAHGAGFVSGATINWNGQPLTTTFVNVDELTATVPASAIAVATSAEVTVTNPTPGGGTSNVVYIAVSSPTDLRFALSPSSGPLPPDVAPNAGVAADLTGGGNLSLELTAPVFGTTINAQEGLTILGNGDGTFQKIISDSGGEGTPPVLGDFNGDGKPDLVETWCAYNPLTGCSISVFLGNGDGTFSEVAAPPSQGEAAQIGVPVVGDFNGDGKLDFAVFFGDSTSAGIMVYLGNGDGTFQNGVLTSTQVGGGLAAGDFDGDGKLDLLTGFGFYHGNGDGTFTFHSGNYSVGSVILVADLNGDGKLDLVSPESTEFGVTLGNGDGTFQPVTLYPVNGSTNDLILGDFRASGKLDLAYSNGTNTIIVPGNGDGTFDTANAVTVPTTPSLFIIAGDFNKDGKLDFAVTYASSQQPEPVETISYMLQDAPIADLSPSSLTFGPQPLGITSSAQTVTLDNTGTGPLKLSVAITGTNSGDFPQASNCPSSLAIAASCQITVTFTPTANGPRSASLSLTDNAPASPQTVTLSGSGGLANVQLSSSLIDFANEAVGNNSPAQTVTLTNVGYSTTNISSISVTGANASDFSETNTCASTLAASANCSISVTFTPAAMGGRSAAVTIVDDAPGSPQTIALAGNGSGIVGLSPSILTFSNQYVGTTGLPQSVTVTNNAATPLTINKVSTSPADFGSLNACGSTLAPGASCAIGVFFDPTAAGSRTGTLTISDSAASSPQTVTLNGTGQDFSMTSSSSNATVSPGQSANYTLAITPGGGFNQTVSLSCAGAPALSTCSVSPNSLALSGSAASSAIVAVTTAANSASLPRLHGLPPTSNLQTARLSVVVLVLLLSSFVVCSRKRSLRWIRPLAFACLLLVVTVLSSCGGGGNGGTGGNHGGIGTPTGTYTLTVTGTFNSGSTTLTHSTTLTLVVQ